MCFAKNLRNLSVYLSICLAIAADPVQFLPDPDPRIWSCEFGSGPDPTYGGVGS